jgi:hypothetical protein
MRHSSEKQNYQAKACHNPPGCGRITLRAGFFMDLRHAAVGMENRGRRQFGGAQAKLVDAYLVEHEVGPLGA